MKVTWSSDAYKAPPAIKAMILGLSGGLRDEMKAMSQSALRS